MYVSWALVFLGFGLLVKPIHKAQHDVARDDVGVVFPTASAVDAGVDVGEVAQDVPGIEHQIEAILHDPLREARIPHQVVAVHGGRFVAPAGEHGQFGG